MNTLEKEFDEILAEFEPSLDIAKYYIPEEDEADADLEKEAVFSYLLTDPVHLSCDYIKFTSRSGGRVGIDPRFNIPIRKPRRPHKQFEFLSYRGGLIRLRDGMGQIDVIAQELLRGVVSDDLLEEEFLRRLKRLPDLRSFVGFPIKMHQVRKQPNIFKNSSISVA